MSIEGRERGRKEGKKEGRREGKKEERRKKAHARWERKISPFSRSSCLLGKQILRALDSRELILRLLNKASEES